MPGNVDETRFSNGVNLEKYQRKYMKLQTLLANIGGIINGIWVVSRLIMAYFVTDFYNQFIANSIYTYKFNKDDTVEIDHLSQNSRQQLKLTTSPRRLTE
jgi:hypothetical protein